MNRRIKGHEGEEEAQRSGSQRPESMSTKSQGPIAESLPGRISASARSLLRDSVLRPSPGATGETLASLPTAGKGDSSSSSGESMSFTETPSSQLTSTSSDESFRSKERDVDVQMANHDFDAFIENSTSPTLEFAMKSGNDAEIHRRDGNSYGDDKDGSHQVLAHASKATPSRSTVSSIDQLESAPKESPLDPVAHSTPTPDESLLTYDGSEVVVMLSNPSLCLEEAPTEYGSNSSLNNHEKPESLYFSRSKDVVFPGAIVNDLQLIPGSANTPAALERMAAAMAQIKDYAQEIDLQPWFEILNSYHDEVWGSMLPLINEAREELRPSTNSKQTLDDKPALRRLQMLIGHLK